MSLTCPSVLQQYILSSEGGDREGLWEIAVDDEESWDA